jgi:ABC-type multidrug transport system ATPase subunit
VVGQSAAGGFGPGQHRGPAPADVTLSVPAGRVVGSVGPNGAGKSTLLNLIVGTIRPTSGIIKVLGARPAANAAQLSEVGFVAQDTPVYAGLTVAEHLRLGAMQRRITQALQDRWTTTQHRRPSNATSAPP